MDKKEWIKYIKTSGVYPIKSLGQNFLIDDRISARIVEAMDIDQTDYILEIGSGMGALTRELAARCGNLVCVEIDQHFREVLERNFSDTTNVDFLFEDFLKMNYKKLLKNEKMPNAVISNLPYCVMTPILLKLFRNWDGVEKMVFMVEKDACERIFANPGSKSYGAISILSSIYGTKERLFQVGAKSFYPEPHTNSEVIRFSKSKENDRIPTVIFPLIHAAFAQRRKTLLNVFSSSGLFPDGRAQVIVFLEKAGITPNMRAENLSPQDYLTLACILEDMVVSLVV